LVSRSTPLIDIPERLGAILDDPDTLCHLIQYEEP